VSVIFHVFSGLSLRSSTYNQSALGGCRSFRFVSITLFFVMLRRFFPAILSRFDFYAYICQEIIIN